MEEAPGISFRMTPAQRRFYEGDSRAIRMEGLRCSRRYASEMFIAATAATPEDAELCLEDLRTVGIALLSSEGKRVEPPRRNGARFACIRFDEEKSD